jgi:hypothetical protein
MGKWRHFLVAGFHIPGPGELEPHIACADLAKGAAAPGALIAPRHKPVLRVRILRYRGGNGREMFQRGISLFPPRPPPGLRVGGDGHHLSCQRLVSFIAAHSLMDGPGVLAAIVLGAVAGRG